MGEIIKLRAYPDASFRDVTAPNADTLYTTAFFDVGDEPWVLSVPDMKGRYFLLPFLDGWTNVFARPGKPHHRNRRADLRHHRSGLVRRRSRRHDRSSSRRPRIVWLLGRIYCTGTPEDYAAVHALQDAFKLQPLQHMGQGSYARLPPRSMPPIDMKTPVRDQVNACRAVEYFTLLADLMKRNPPDRRGRAGAGALQGDRHRSRQELRRQSPRHAMGRAPAAALLRPHHAASRLSLKRENGWLFTTKTGVYGTDYLQRALVTAIGLGANRPQDAVYPMSQRASLLEAV